METFIRESPFLGVKMKIISNEEKLIEYIKKPEIMTLLNYFEKQENPVILREIKNNFPSMRHLDQYLDRLISFEIIFRRNRRYYLHIPQLKAYPLIESWNKINQLAEETAKITLISFLIQNYWQEKYPGTIAVDFNLPEITQIANEEYQLITVNVEKRNDFTIPNYFSFQTEDYPESFEQLEKLIGDVNQEFYFNQVSTVLDFVLKQKKPRRETIYSQSLIVTDLIQLDPVPKILVPVVDEIPDLPELDAELKKLSGDIRYFAIRRLMKILVPTWRQLIT